MHPIHLRPLLCALLALVPLLLSACSLPGFRQAAVPQIVVETLTEAPVTQCSHDFQQGRCLKCGELCDHSFTEGVCTVCGYVCPHSSHGQDLICPECGELVWHHYKESRCTVCGKELELCMELPPEELLSPCDRQGTVEAVDLGTERPRNCLVYTPYGYDSAKQYDVVFLLHGSKGDPADLTTRVHQQGDLTWTLCDLYDQMIDRHLCRPFILVAPDYLNWYHAIGDAAFARELKEVVMPRIAEVYGTFAEDGSYDSLVAARKHILIGGLSLGAQYTHDSLLPGCLDICSHFLLMSGGKPNSAVCQAIDQWEYDLDDLYLTVGERETLTGMVTLYRGLLAGSEKLQPDVNFRMDILPGMWHSWGNWTTCLLNGLPFLLE